MNLTLIIIIYLCGLLAMTVELIIPGAVLGTLGFLAVAGSIIAAVAMRHNTAAVILTLCTLAFLPVFFLTWKNVVGKFFAIKRHEGGFRPSQTLTEELVGTEGVALSPLRPSGIARLAGKRYDVVTRGEMLDRGARVKVIEVSGNRIVVREI